MTLPTLIAELEEALKAATDGPWRCQMDKSNHRCLIAFDDTWSKDLTLGAVWSSLHDEPPANARLIALMRNSLPTLIEALKRQGEALRELYDCGCVAIDALDDSDSFSENDMQALEDALHEARAALRTLAGKE